jgi:hypothetical protein
VFFFLLAMAAKTGFRLLILVSDWISFDMELVAGGTVDSLLVVHAANKADPPGACVFIRMTDQAGVDLFFPGRDSLTASKRGQRRKTAATMRP